MERVVDIPLLICDVIEGRPDECSRMDCVEPCWSRRSVCLGKRSEEKCINVPNLVLIQREHSPTARSDMSGKRCKLLINRTVKIK